MKFRSFLFALIVLLNITLFSQNETSKWYFGYNAGLDFMTNPPTILTNGQVLTYEGSSSASDGAGNLLFYTDGTTVWNSQQQVMQNGTGLFGNPSTTQAALVIKQPGNTNIYFVFTLDMETLPNGLCYSVVDMNLAAGSGAVTTKNIQLMTPSCEKMAGVPHCNGVDTWLVTHDYGSDVFRAHQVTAAGVNPVPVLSSAGLNINSNWGDYAGQIKFSHDGSKLAAAVYQIDSVGTDIGAFQLFDFDNATGIVSNAITLAKGPIYNYAYGCDFSPDGTKLYGSRFDNNSYGNDIMQWDLSTGIPQSIVASYQVVGSTSVITHGMELGPDGKIYVARQSEEYLGVINNPNAPGISCNYVDLGQSLFPSVCANSLPGFVKNIPTLTISLIPEPVDCNSLGSATVFVLGGASPYTYLWMPSAQTSSIATNLTAGIYTLQLTNMYGCSLSYTTSIDSESPLSGTVTTMNPLCYGINDGSASIFVTGFTGPLIYSWSGTAQTSSLATGLPPGTYTVTATDQSIPCIFTSMFQLNAQIATQLSITANTVCAGQTLNFYANLPGVSYNWSGPNTFTSSLQNPALPNANPGMSGVYTLTVTTPQGCVANASVNALVTPGFTASAFSNAPCENQTLSFNGGAATSYQWVGPNNFSSNLQSPMINNVVLSSAGIYTLISEIGICRDTVTLGVTIYPLPLPIASSSGTVCENEWMQLMVNNSGTSYNWTGPGNYVSSMQNPTLVGQPTRSGQYMVTVTGTNGCQASAATTVIVVVAPSAIAWPANSCAGQRVSLSASGGSSYSWTGPAGFLANGQSVDFIPSGPHMGGTYTLTTSGTNNCTATTTVFVTVYALPSATLNGAIQACASSCQEFKLKGTSTSYFKTLFRVNNETITGPGLYYCFKKPGDYFASVIFTDTNNCINTSTLSVKIFEKPKADFEFIPFKPIAGAEEVVFTNTSSGPDQKSWTWFFINNSNPSLSGQRIPYRFETAGSFPVAMIVKNKWGCADTIVKAVFVEDEFSIYVPNAFTPDDDGINDLFQPKGTGIRNYQLMIFDRWGARLFSTTDFLTPWDGSFKGVGCKEDVYIWKIIVNGTDNKIKELQGHVTLYR